MADTKLKPVCATPPPVPREVPSAMPLDRQRAVIRGAAKWVNGTVLRYAFFDGSSNPAWGPANDAQVEAVREGFRTWKDVGIGLEFIEVDDLAEAEVRIGFDQSDGSWSYIGRDILGQPATDRTMNFGWDLTTDWGKVTVVHEQGHTLGMPHEHQNPFAGIVWDDEAVYASFAGEPNRWSREQTFHNVLRKLDPTQVDGSKWDPESVMEYPFPPNLIREPEAYRQGVPDPIGISDLDKEWMLKWYPGDQAPPRALQPFQSAQATLEAQQQIDFALSPPASREYEIALFGSGEAVAVVFEQVGDSLRYLAGDDDGGEPRNANLKLKLFQGREYVLRVRLYWPGESGELAVMYW